MVITCLQVSNKSQVDIIREPSDWDHLCWLGWGLVHLPSWTYLAETPPLFSWFVKTNPCTSCIFQQATSPGLRHCWFCPSCFKNINIEPKINYSKFCSKIDRSTTFFISNPPPPKKTNKKNPIDTNIKNSLISKFWFNLHWFWSWNELYKHPVKMIT